ncbi:MAG: FecR domain-containing protein, partial [Pseudomonadota bacterium]
LIFGSSFDATAEVEVATVVFASGEVQIVDVDRRKRFVIKGDLIFSNETLVTGDGRAQVKFTDDGRVSLKPNTIYSISDYFYDENEQSPTKSFFELVTGTVRFVTGKIAKRNRASFAIKTQTATIGVRGSSGQITSCVDRSCRGRLDGTYLTTYDGVLTITSGDSELEVHPNESAFCAADGSGCSKTETASTEPVEQIGPNLGPSYQQGDQIEHDHQEISPPTSPDPQYSPPTNGGYRSNY